MGKHIVGKGPYCRYCGGYVYPSQREHKYQTVHTYCALQQPFDLKIKCGNFTAELHTELIGRRNLNKLLSSVNKLDKQIQRDKKKGYDKK